MNPATGEIHYYENGNIPKGYINIEPAEVELVTGMTTLERKGWARNKPCPCGSGRKFKKCCY